MSRAFALGMAMVLAIVSVAVLQYSTPGGLHDDGIGASGGFKQVNPKFI